MALILECRGFMPKFGNNNFVAPNATVVGDVEIGDDQQVMPFSETCVSGKIVNAYNAMKMAAEFSK